MQIRQRVNIRAGRADLHASAGDGIEHPVRQHNDNARRRLDVNDPAASALLTVVLSNAAPIKRMPAIMDLDFRSDMGRMNGRWRWA